MEHHHFSLGKSTISTGPWLQYIAILTELFGRVFTLWKFNKAIENGHLYPFISIYS